MSKEIEGIINRALQYKKIKKEKAQEIIKDIYWNYPELAEPMAMLYSYFMPPMPSRAKPLFDLAYEFLIDGDEFMSEDEALQHFLPFRYNDDLVNKALAWINTRGIGKVQP